MRSPPVALGILTCAAQLLSAQSAAQDVGKAHFRLYCAPCHGIQAQGGRAPDLRQSTADLFLVISKGVEGTEMSGYSSQFNDATIQSIVSYIRSTARTTPQPRSGDPKRGLAVFQNQGACAACHATGGIGPSLARVGRQRSLDYIREKILHPDLNITPGYRTLTVTLKDGTKIRGIPKGRDDFSAQLIDINRRFYSFRTEETSAIEQDTGSLMPARQLTAAQLADLLAYLSTLRGTAGSPGTAASTPDLHD
jgi:putative heme-binding domain-containing protein